MFLHNSIGVLLISQIVMLALFIYIILQTSEKFEVNTTRFIGYTVCLGLLLLFLMVYFIG